MDFTCQPLSKVRQVQDGVLESWVQSLSIMCQNLIICCIATCSPRNYCVDYDGLAWNTSTVRHLASLVLPGAKRKNPDLSAPMLLRYQ